MGLSVQSPHLGNACFPHPIHEVIIDTVLGQQFIGPGVDTRLKIIDFIIIPTPDLIFLAKAFEFQSGTRHQWEKLEFHP